MRKRLDRGRPGIAAVSVCLILLFTWAGECQGTDESGCLTCHAYMGLVIADASGRVHPLNIIERVRDRSPHADVACGSCHVRIDRTPHVGIEEIDCTASCHQENRAAIAAILPDQRKIHAGEQSAIATIELPSSCVRCHSIYPHKKDRHIRAIFNLHSAHLYCEVCHLRLDAPDDFSYRWSPGDKVTFTGEAFGKIVKPDPAEGAFQLLSRIAVYRNRNGEASLVQHGDEFTAAGAYLGKEQQLSDVDKAKALEKFHGGIVKKEITVACAECHRKEGRLDFRALGYSNARALELEQLNIKGWAMKYDTFYFPKLF